VSARRGATGSDTIAIAISCVSSGSSASDDTPIRYGTAQGSPPTLDTDAGPANEDVSPGGRADQRAHPSPARA